MPHGIETGAMPPIYEYGNKGNATDEISELLRAQVKAAAADSANGGTGDSSSSFDSILLVTPSLEDHDRSAWAYIAYSYAHIYAHRQITAQDPSEQTPKGFEELRQDVIKHSTSLGHPDEGLQGGGVFHRLYRGPGRSPSPGASRTLSGMYTLDVPLRTDGDVAPAYWSGSSTASIRCGICEQTFDVWLARQWHRNNVHGTEEALDAFPDNA